MKTWLYNKRKQYRLWRSLNARRKERLTLKTTLSKEESFSVPIVINNCNRLTYLKQLIDWLEANNYKNIFILDNASTYPPLLEFYKSTKHKVIYLGANIGYLALWKSEFFTSIKNSYYVYTDPDVVPNKNCPGDLVFKLYEVLTKYSEIEKAGPALLINDLPESYKSKQDVIAAETKYWKKELEKDVYDAPVDTTFALYRPLAQGNAEECKAYRVGGNYSIHHLPWYEDTANPTEENLYYKSKMIQGTSVWTDKS
ncbi:MAG: glycosyltransferase family 2 protein [Sphingobacteriaceae bacterium]|nr:glycosyltransferase family 2 protein [Sphingobacteriaceae bacterium]